MDITHKFFLEDNLYEPACQMTIFYKMGKISLMDDTFLQCQAILREQLDSTLSSQTLSHYNHLKAIVGKEI